MRRVTRSRESETVGRRCPPVITRSGRREWITQAQRHVVTGVAHGEWSVDARKLARQCAVRGHRIPRKMVGEGESGEGTFEQGDRFDRRRVGVRQAGQREGDDAGAEAVSHQVDSQGLAFGVGGDPPDQRSRLRAARPRLRGSSSASRSTRGAPPWRRARACRSGRKRPAPPPPPSVTSTPDRISALANSPKTSSAVLSLPSIPGRSASGASPSVDSTVTASLNLCMAANISSARSWLGSAASNEAISSSSLEPWGNRVLRSCSCSGLRAGPSATAVAVSFSPAAPGAVPPGVGSKSGMGHVAPQLRGPPDADESDLAAGAELGVQQVEPLPVQGGGCSFVVVPAVGEHHQVGHVAGVQLFDELLLAG